MKIIIDTDKIENPEVFGEILREYCFDTYLDRKTGCYNKFDLRPEFTQLIGLEASQFIEKFLSSEICWGNWYKNINIDPMDKIPQQEFLDKFLCNIYSNGDIIISWYWDADGILLIGNKVNLACNGDCKCSYGWEFC